MPSRRRGCCISSIPAASWSRPARSSSTASSLATTCRESSSDAAPRFSPAGTAWRPGRRVVLVGRSARGRRACRRDRRGRQPGDRSQRAPAERALGRRNVAESSSTGRPSTADALALSLALVPRTRPVAAGNRASGHRRRRGRRPRLHARGGGGERPPRRPLTAHGGPQEQAARTGPIGVHVPLRGRRGQGSRAGLARGLPLDRAAQALHDRDNGHLPGSAVPRAPAELRRRAVWPRTQAVGRPDDRPPAGARADARAAAAGVRDDIEHRTSLHDRHLELGAVDGACRRVGCARATTATFGAEYLRRTRRPSA